MGIGMFNMEREVWASDNSGSLSWGGLVVLFWGPVVQTPLNPKLETLNPILGSCSASAV